jgi:hypothetical protein
VYTQADVEPLLASLMTSIAEQENCIIARLMKGLDTAPLEKRLQEDVAKLHRIQRRPKVSGLRVDGVALAS